jgi:hypothetical protein
MGDQPDGGDWSVFRPDVAVRVVKQAGRFSDNSRKMDRSPWACAALCVQGVRSIFRQWGLACDRRSIGRKTDQTPAGGVRSLVNGH